MTTAAERRIVVSQHAIEQSRYRFDRPRLTKTEIAADVADAVRAGRLAKHLPRCALNVWHANGHSDRICWSEDENRAYVLGKNRSRQAGTIGEDVWIVRTAFPIEKSRVAL